MPSSFDPVRFLDAATQIGIRHGWRREDAEDLASEALLTHLQSGGRSYRHALAAHRWRMADEARRATRARRSGQTALGEVDP